MNEIYSFIIVCNESIPIFFQTNNGVMKPVDLYLENGNMDFDKVKNLCENDIDKSSSILKIAIRAGDFEIVSYLIDYGYRLHVRNLFNIFISLEMNDNIEKCIKYVLENSDSEELHKIILETSSSNGYINLVKYLIDKNFNVNSSKNCALRKSARNGHTEIVRILIDANADVNGEAIKLASENGHLDIVRILVEAGADIMRDNNYPLIYSIRNGHFDVVMYLISQGANYKNLWKGKNALIYCSCTKGDYIEMFRYLAELDMDFDDKTMLNNAAFRNNYRIAEFIIKRGVSLDIINTFLKTTLEIQNLELIKLSVENGADLTLINKLYIEKIIDRDNIYIFRYIESLGIDIIVDKKTSLHKKIKKYLEQFEKIFVEYDEDTHILSQNKID